MYIFIYIYVFVFYKKTARSGMHGAYISLRATVLLKAYYSHFLQL